MGAGAGICTEALLDIEYIKAVAGDIPLTDISNAQYSLLNWAKQLDMLQEPPLVMSVSYGNDEVQQSSPEYMDACNAQFMKLGMRGISVLIASGDQGVYGRTGGNEQFNPDFPASSPMGFLNPFIYQVGMKGTSEFNDVKLGTNSAEGPHGFRALPGWDPATGFGSPNFSSLAKAAFAAMPSDSSVVVV